MHCRPSLHFPIGEDVELTNGRVSLNFRQNWPLLVAGGLLFLAAVFVCAAIPYHQARIDGIEQITVIYPLAVFSSSTVFIFLILSLVALLFLGVYALYKPVSRNLFILLMMLGLIFSLVASLILNAPLPFVAVVLVSLIFGILGLQVRSEEWNTWIPVLRVLGVVLSANVLLCYACFMFFNEVVNKETISFGQHVYSLAVNQSSSDDWECMTRRVDVYQCDSVGLVCHVVYASKSYYECSSLKEVPPENMKLITVANRLYLQLGDEKVLIAQN